MVRIIIALLLLVTAAQAQDLSTALTYNIASSAPVQSVNSQTGSVTLPVLCRQVSSPLTVNTTDGTASWTFPNTVCSFAAAPTCFPTLNASSTSYVFYYPTVAPTTTTGVSATATAQSKTLTISLGTLSLVGLSGGQGVPSGTTITFSCFAPQQ